ncbi:MAG TPA: aldo/keto reductase [Daejeonella sp.]
MQIENQSVTPSIGLGCVTFGREVDDLTAFGLMDHAYSKGIRFFDTASSYSAGGSEIIIGKWLKLNSSIAPDMTIATKISPPYSAGSIRASVKKSLNNLGVSSLDLVLFHDWDNSIKDPEVLETIDNLTRTGFIKIAGCSNFTAAQLKYALLKQDSAGYSRFKYIQNLHNYAVSMVDDQLIKVCNRYNVKLIIYSPLGAGFLTGKHKKQVVLGSRFDLVPAHRRIYFNDSAGHRLDILLDTARIHQLKPEDLGMAWVMNQPSISIVLVGARNFQHIDQAFSSLNDRTCNALKVM